jgi:4-amino-4-deoxy-L-arabinose transferase-like glycosyltransferase
VIRPPLSRLSGAGAVLLATVVWLSLTAWVRPLMLPDEGRYVGVAWEMVRSGHWLVPTLDGLPYFHKPPLFYWITAASLSLFGMHEWAARLAPLLGATAAVAALFLFARRWVGLTTARLAVLVLATEPLFFAGAQFANLDMLVAGCISVTVLAFAGAVLARQEGRAPRSLLAVGYAFGALGLLAKGLIGVVLPGMVLVAWLLAVRRPRAILSLLWLPGLVLFAVIAAPWFVAMQERFASFADYFFIVQHFKRYTQAGFNNAMPFWYYLAVVPLATLPWMPWLPAAVRRGYWNDARHGQVRKLMWLWLVLVTLFFSLPRSKLVGYILPATVPLAYLIGDVVAAGWSQSGRRRRLAATSAVLAAITGLAVIAGSVVVRDNSLRTIGRALAAQARPGEPIVFLHGYYFDLAFYARLAAPVRVVEDWADPKFTKLDDWHKELLDARQFAAADAPPVLLMPTDLPGVLCSGPATWLVGDAKLPQRYPVLASATEMARKNTTVLWRLPGRASGPLSAAGCRETPSANSAGM